MVEVRSQSKCNRGSDCQVGECCIANVQPIGKRQLIIPTFSGHCQKMPTKGESCLVSNFLTDDYLTTTVFGCPCRDGFKCTKTPESLFLVPIGWQGECA